MPSHTPCTELCADLLCSKGRRGSEGTATHPGHGACPSPSHPGKGEADLSRGCGGAQGRADGFKSNSRTSGHFATLWAARPDRRAAPPSLQVGASFVDLDARTGHTHSGSHVKTWMRAAHGFGGPSLPASGRAAVITRSVPFHQLLHRLTPKHGSLCHGRAGFSKPSQCGLH